MDVGHVPLEQALRALVTEVEVRGHTETMNGEVVLKERDEVLISLRSDRVGVSEGGPRIWEVTKEHIVSLS